MKKIFTKLCTGGLLFTVVAATVGCGGAASPSNAEISAAKARLDEILAGKELTGQYLAKFDTLDFVVYSNQQWTRLHESHGENITVHYPDGSVTVGIPDHITELKKTFVWAPDTKITEHPIAFGDGRFTAVTGVMEGTFSRPMPMADGTTMAPTGKRFKISVATIGVWEDGTMVEEHLFWDNLSFMRQIGAM